MNSAQRIIQEIEEVIRLVYGREEGPIPLHAPSFRGRERDYVRDCIDTGWVSSVGAYVSRFEQMLADYAGSRYAVATVNGTAALHVSLVLAGVGQNDGVLCPAFSFVATVSPVVYCKAVPVFMDSDPLTMGMDVRKVARYLGEHCVKNREGYAYDKKTGGRIKACVPMHAYGYPSDIDGLIEMCSEYNITIIEDAAEALGSRYRGRHCGTFGTIGVFSFNGNKIITTGGGGMIVTDDEDIANKAKHITTTAKKDHPWEYLHDDIGYNFRMPNINAALGCAQMEQLESLLSIKRKQSKRFHELILQVAGVDSVMPDPEDANCWLNLVRVPSNDRSEILEGLNGRGIQARASWMPICDMPPYRTYEQFEIQTARVLFAEVICLPNGVLNEQAPL